MGLDLGDEGRGGNSCLSALFPTQQKLLGVFFFLTKTIFSLHFSLPQHPLKNLESSAATWAA